MELSNPCLGFCLRIVGTGLWSVLGNLCVFLTRQAARRLACHSRNIYDIEIRTSEEVSRTAFLKDQNVAKAIADTVDACPDIPVLEVGPGMGVLTQYLLPKKRETKVVEIDFESVAYLREEYPQLEENIIEDDFLKMHLEHTFGGRPFVLTGNYPYNISSQIFFKMLDYRELIPCCTGMIQKEVAERLAAKPGCKAYGILSVLVQLWYDVEYLFTVEPGVFNPPPKVKSAVIRMTRNEATSCGCDERLLRRVVKTTFNQRRK